MEEDEIINEVETKHSEIKTMDLSLHEVSKSVCKIIFGNPNSVEIKDDEKIDLNFATGFLFKLNKEDKEFLCLMTNEHVITRDMVKLNVIIDLNYNLGKKWIKIKLDEKERFIKCDKENDTTIVEIIPKDKIKDKYFLIPNINNINYKDKEIYIVQYHQGIDYSYGSIKICKNNKLIYNASTKSGSSGSPIFIKDTTTVIGIHRGGFRDKKMNTGILISSIIKSLYNEKKRNKKYINK